MYGAIIGDIVGSVYEFNPIKTKDFPFVSRGCTFTDDTVMTVAVAKALLDTRTAAVRGEDASYKHVLVHQMQRLGRAYFDRGYGGRFALWLQSTDTRPYNSFGNGSAMRVSPCGILAVELEEALDLAKASAEVTHDHPEGIRGAQAVAACIFLAKAGRTKDQICNYVEQNFYQLPESVSSIRPSYDFDVTCQGSVPQAITCFLEATSYEDAVRNAVSLGGDADTQAAIAGSIAWTYYRLGRGFREIPGNRHVEATGGRIWTLDCNRIVADYGINALLPAEFVQIINDFDTQRSLRDGTYDRVGSCARIPL